jgi:hypothetical protein
VKRKIIENGTFKMERTRQVVATKEVDRFDW